MPDPHPGNVFITSDHKLALIDLGMVSRIDPEIREKLIKLLIYVSDGHGTEAANVAFDLSTPLEDFDRNNFVNEVREFVLQYQDAKLEQINVGRFVIELSQIAANNRIRTSPELTMIGKALLNLDQIGKILEPEFNPNAVIRQYSEMVLRKHLFKNFSSGNIYSSFLETKELLQKLPIRLNTIFESLAKNELEIKVKAFDELRLVENFQKVANRISMGLILAALIISAAMLMQVKTTFTIFGYPGFAMIMFLIAAGLGLRLVLSILLQDESRRKKKG